MWSTMHISVRSHVKRERKSEQRGYEGESEKVNECTRGREREADKNTICTHLSNRIITKVLQHRFRAYNQPASKNNQVFGNGNEKRFRNKVTHCTSTIYVQTIA